MAAVRHPEIVGRNREITEEEPFVMDTPFSKIAVWKL